MRIIKEVMIEVTASLIVGMVFLITLAVAKKAIEKKEVIVEV
jgi:hypothetical protein